MNINNLTIETKEEKPFRLLDIDIKITKFFVKWIKTHNFKKQNNPPNNEIVCSTREWKYQSFFFVEKQEIRNYSPSFYFKGQNDVIYFQNFFIYGNYTTKIYIYI